jgi:hypothetical protein
MKYSQEKYNEARSRSGYYNMLNETIDLILSIFATVPQLTKEQWREASLNEFPHMYDAVNAILAKKGPMIAAKPADGMVSLEGVRKACTAMLLDDHGWNVSDAIYAARVLCERTLEVPARAVHKMEYPEDVTYTHDPWANKDACNLCGAYVSDQAKHTAWHEGKV